MTKNNSLNIIHDFRLLDRFEPLLEELKKQNISDYKLWSPVEDSKSVVRSINLSHKQIVQWAKENKMPYVIIAEDDLMFTCDGAWEYFLENMPSEFDLYLGCTYIVPIQNNKICGFHLYAIGESFYDAFLNTPEDVHIDTEMNNIVGNYFFCYPFPALQRKGFSLNNKTIVDYNTILEEGDKYNAAIYNISRQG